ncbi:OmpH family outer membrane protein [Lentisphaera profundi]|uniref:OmpH family outer membrane protein n=1 Tax=Lentisphaera profundi TaxID=1658616 RepID=A0ABY7W144_9BACT|nr:OmpH family outer membrane protein [Lentisphaera profundi]WDE97993.1 OmpH family outer membrane protein [Lentisphaera profundi]
MKKIFLLALILSAPLVQALEIVTVDMNKVFENYYRTLIENKKLAKEKDITQSRLKEMQAQVYKLQTDYQTLMRESMNPALSEGAQTQKKQDAEAKATEGQSTIKNLKFFQQNLQKEAVAKRRSITEELTKDIKKVITKYANDNAIDLVIDSSGKSVNGINLIIHSNPSLAITEKILATVNKGHEDFVKKIQDDKKSETKK